jgi:hypothetical protein
VLFVVSSAVCYSPRSVPHITIFPFVLCLAFSLSFETSMRKDLFSHWDENELKSGRKLFCPQNVYFDIKKYELSTLKMQNKNKKQKNENDTKSYCLLCLGCWGVDSIASALFVLDPFQRSLMYLNHPVNVGEFFEVIHIHQWIMNVTCT